MTRSLIRRGLLAALAAAVLPTALLAQQSDSVPDTTAFQLPEQEEVQGWLTEIQEIHGKLEEIQRLALEDPQLLASQSALGASIKATMERVDPTLPQTMARVPLLEGEVQAAREAGDQARLQALGIEAEQIQQQFMAAQEQALQQPDLAAQVQAFQQQLEMKMLEVDPAAAGLISRYKELEAKLSAAIQGRG